MPSSDVPWAKVTIEDGEWRELAGRLKTELDWATSRITEWEAENERLRAALQRCERFASSSMLPRSSLENVRVEARDALGEEV